ncbi:MAG: signal peptidase II [Pirellulales bacterium]|nr:signal peptidase II [Pirellulales bacterium]
MRAVPLKRLAAFILIAVAGCTADLLTKSWMFNSLGIPPFGRTRWIWEGVFGFQTSLNYGALFGLGQGWNPLFAGLSIFAALGILIWLFFGGALHDRLLTAALACIMAGILGNLYDRLGLPGLVHPFADGASPAGAKIYAVRDFILVMIGPWQWPNFNLADSLLVCGAALLIWHALQKKHEIPAEIASPTNSP